MVVEGRDQLLPEAEEIPDLLVLGVRADVLDVDGGRHVDDDLVGLLLVAGTDNRCLK